MNSKSENTHTHMILMIFDENVQKFSINLKKKRTLVSCIHDCPHLSPDLKLGTQVDQNLPKRFTFWTGSNFFEEL